MRHFTSACTFSSLLPQAQCIGHTICVRIGLRFHEQVCDTDTTNTKRASTRVRFYTYESLHNTSMDESERLVPLSHFSAARGASCDNMALAKVILFSTDAVHVQGATATIRADFSAAPGLLYLCVKYMNDGGEKNGDHPRKLTRP